MDRAQHFAGPGLATADDCDDGEEVSRVRLQYPKHLMSCTIALAHTLTPSHTVRCLDRDTDVYLYFTKLLRLRHFRIFRLQKPTVLTRGPMADSTGTVASPRSALRTKPSSQKSPQQSPRRALRLQLPVSDVGASDDSKQVEGNARPR